MAGIAIPSILGFRAREFDLTYKQQITPSGAGFVQTLDRSVPLWTAKYATPPLRAEKLNAWDAFKDTLEGSMGTFLGYDPRRIMPSAYANLPITADPWTLGGQVAPRVISTNYANSTITVDRLASGAIISLGDLVCFYNGFAWHLYRVRGATVITGNTSTLTVAPRPPTQTGLPFDIRYRKACAEMKIIGKPSESDSVDSRPTISFNAVQIIARPA